MLVFGFSLCIVFRDAWGKPVTVIAAVLSFAPMWLVSFPAVIERDRATVMRESEEEQSLENYKRREKWKNRTL